MKPRASFRLFRSGLIGSLVLGLAAGGHLAGGGQLPTPPILAALCAITMLPVAALTRFRLSFPVLTGLIGGGQLWLHWGFDALSVGTPAAAAPALLSVHAGHNAATLHPETLLLAAPAHGAAPGELMASRGAFLRTSQADFLRASQADFLRTSEAEKQDLLLDTDGDQK
jgi:hypothetical protein